jgi:opacity protein-like surface antigen
MRSNRRGRWRYGAPYAYVLAGVCALATGPAVGHAQMNVEPGTANDPPATQAERAERARQADRARAADVAPPDRVRYQEEYHRPGELYVAGFGGYTFGGSSFTNAQFAGNATRGFVLNDSGIYGLKIGYFMPDRLNWLGFEVEGFNTSPNLKPSGNGPGGTPLPGASLRVSTLAFNAIIRGKFACGPSRNEPSRRTTTETHRTTVETQRNVYGDREDTFCPLQPYVGAGIGVFFAHTNGIGGMNSASDNAVPGFNGLAGVRYFMTEHIAVFGEYKYNRATFNFDRVSALGGLSGDYSVHNVVGGLSFHF